MHRQGQPIFYGYAIVAAAFVLSFASGPGQSFAFSVFQPEIVRDTGISAIHFSLIYALGSGFSAMLVFALGRALDRFGVRATSGVLAGLLFASSAAMALASGFLSLLVALAMLRAIGQGCLPTTAQVLTSQWFVSRRGTALSLATMGVVAANAIHPPLFYFLIEHFGWRTTYFWTGAALGLSIALLALFVIRNRPEDVGLHPDGAAEAIPEVPSEHTAATANRAVWQTGRFWALALPLSVPPFVSTATVFHQVSLFEAQGLSAQNSAHALTILAFAAGTGTLSAGWLLQRIGVRKTTVGMLLLLALSMALLAIMNSPALAVCYSLLLGFSIGLWAVTNAASWPHYYGRQKLGGVQGSAATILIAASAIGPLPVAFLHASLATHRSGIAFLLGVSILAALVTFSRPPKHTS